MQLVSRVGKHSTGTIMGAETHQHVAKVRWVVHHKRARRRQGGEIIFLSPCASSPVCIMSTRPGCVLHDGEHGVLRGKNPRYASNADFNLARSASLGTRRTHTAAAESQSSSKLRAYPWPIVCDCAGAAGATYLHTYTHVFPGSASQVRVSAHEQWRIPPKQ